MADRCRFTPQPPRRRDCLRPAGCRAGRGCVVAGMGPDIAGARAAIALAERIGAAVDHMNSGAVLRDVEVMRTAGMVLTTPNEVRLRADVLLLIGAGLVGARPDRPDRF